MATFCNAPIGHAPAAAGHDQQFRLGAHTYFESPLKMMPCQRFSRNGFCAKAAAA